MSFGRTSSIRPVESYAVFFSGKAAPDSPPAGLPDSGLPDSGLPDSGLPDSGLPDWGPPGGSARKFEGDAVGVSSLGMTG